MLRNMKHLNIVQDVIDVLKLVHNAKGAIVLHNFIQSNTFGICDRKKKNGDVVQLVQCQIIQFVKRKYYNYMFPIMNN